jgi:enterochelin esterase-like enzyme
MNAAAARLGRLTLYLALATTALVGGAWGTWRYGFQYATYRGFGPPKATVAPAQRGRLVSFTITSPALGNRPARVWAYLPAAYRADPTRRFPSIYLLQGMPGTGYTAYVDAFHIAPTLDAAIAAGRLQPMLAIIPPGTWSGLSPATEWADGPSPGSQWDTFLTRDVVRAVDARFRTIPDAASRGIGGYSAGANEAMNAVILHPGLFGVAEAWSGDFTQAPRLVHSDPVLVARYSALRTALEAGPELRAERPRLFIYVGSQDDGRARSDRFVAELRADGMNPTYTVTTGGHSWRLWHDQLPTALTFFSTNLRSLPCPSCVAPVTSPPPCSSSPPGAGSSSSGPSPCPGLGSSTPSPSTRARGTTRCRSSRSSRSGSSRRRSPAFRSGRASPRRPPRCSARPSSSPRSRSRGSSSSSHASPRRESTSTGLFTPRRRGSRAASAPSSRSSSGAGRERRKRTSRATESVGRLAR